MTEEQSGSGGSTAARSAHTPDAGVSLVGGHPVLDFANTVAWRTDPARSVERVTGAAAWVRWAAAAGLLTPRQSAELLDATAAADPERVRRRLASLEGLRAALWAVLDALTDGRAAAARRVGDAAPVRPAGPRELRTAARLPAALAARRG